MGVLPAITPVVPSASALADAAELAASSSSLRRSNAVSEALGANLERMPDERTRAMCQSLVPLTAWNEPWYGQLHGGRAHCIGP